MIKCFFAIFLAAVMGCACVEREEVFSLFEHDEIRFRLAESQDFLMIWKEDGYTLCANLRDEQGGYLGAVRADSLRECLDTLFQR